MQTTADTSFQFKDTRFSCVDEPGMQIALIIIPVLLTFTTLLVVAFILWKSCRKERGTKGNPVMVLSAVKSNYLERNLGVFNEGASFEDLPPYQESLLEKWELPSDREVKNIELVCDGRFRSVHRVTITKIGESKDALTAIVRECAETTSPGKVREFLDLIKFHVKVCNHPSLVKMLWCQTTAPPLRLYLEDVHPGNLLHFLWRLRQQSDSAGTDHLYELTEKRVFSMALQLARGLTYLTRTLKLIHGHVAACNVLIDQDMNVRLCGLGLAAEVYKLGALSHGKAAQVPIKWLAPERMVKRIITEKSDVWSFGVFLYEVVTLGSPPYPELLPSEVLPKLKSGYRMQQPEQCNKDLFGIMNRCWQWKSRNRLNFSELVDLLDSCSSLASDEKLLTATDTLDLSQYGFLSGLDSRDAKSQIWSV